MQQKITALDILRLQVCCLPFAEYGGITLIPEFNDGLVSVSSVESQSYFHSLGHSPNCHVFLLGNYEYLLAYGVLSGKE